MTPPSAITRTPPQAKLGEENQARTESGDYSAAVARSPPRDHANHTLVAGCDRVDLVDASGRRFPRAALREVLDASATDFNPGMFRLLEDRPYGSRISRVRHRSDRDANQPGQVGGLPVNGRAAGRA